MFTRRIAIALMALAAFGVTACGGGTAGGGSASSGVDDRPPASHEQTAATITSKIIYLVGHPDAVGAAAALVKGFETRINGTPGPDDVVLFVVTAVDGPMPATREQAEALRGKDYGPAAILMVKTEQQDDQELRQLVVQEMHELLARAGVPHADDLPVILGDDPNLQLTLQGLAG